MADLVTRENPREVWGVVFRDKSRFLLTIHYQRCRVYHRRGEHCCDPCIFQTRGFRGDEVTFLGCKSWVGFHERKFAHTWHNGTLIKNSLLCLLARTALTKSSLITKLWLTDLSFKYLKDRLSIGHALRISMYYRTFCSIGNSIISYRAYQPSSWKATWH